MLVSRSCSAYSSKGFALIELMIVIAIIAILPQLLSRILLNLGKQPI